MEERTLDETHEIEFVEAAPPEPKYPTPPVEEGPSTAGNDTERSQE